MWLLWTRNWALFSNAKYLTDCHMYLSVCCFSLIWNLFKVVTHCKFFSPHFILCISVSKKNQTNINFLKKSKPRKALNHNIIYFTFIKSWIAVFITNTFINQSKHCGLFFTHTINFCLYYLRWFQVSIHLGNWSHVLNYVNKAENTSELAEVKI